MRSKHKVLCIVGTRPEGIKMGPVVHALRRMDPSLTVKLVSTAQHRALLDEVLQVFDLSPDIDLDLMRPNQSLNALTVRALEAIGDVLEREKPHAVLAQGDTTTVLCAALACFYLRVPFGHVEAGLRTGDVWNPYPEELNRVLAGRVAHLHFAPTASAKQNLLHEGVAPASIYVTGNTGIDALLSVASRSGQHPLAGSSRRLVLLTAHRRESFGAPLSNVFRAIRQLVHRFPDVQVLYPVHPNPNVRGEAFRSLGDEPRVSLTEPLSYQSFVQALKAAELVITDSGGVQEEAPALGKPVLVIREETERPEAVAMGVAKLVGTDADVIFREAELLLSDGQQYASMAKGVSPYGDGKASGRIAETILTFLRAP